MEVDKGIFLGDTTKQNSPLVCFVLSDIVNKQKSTQNNIRIKADDTSYAVES